MTKKTEQHGCGAQAPRKFYALVHPGGPRGLALKKPRMRKQAKRAKAGECYAVVFFPKITGLWGAMVDLPSVYQSMAQTPAAAIAKFMDHIKRGETWETYHDAGHRVRRLRVVDLGDPEISPLTGPMELRELPNTDAAQEPTPEST